MLKRQFYNLILLILITYWKLKIEEQCSEENESKNFKNRKKNEDPKTQNERDSEKKPQHLSSEFWFFECITRLILIYR